MDYVPLVPAVLSEGVTIFLSPTLLHTGSNSDVIHSILRLGIALLEEGNHLVQEEMLAQLQAMDVGFLSSVARLVASCSVLDWNAYQRYQRTEVMQSTSCLGQFAISVW